MLPVKVSRSNKATTHCSAEQKYLTNFFCNSENLQNMIKSIRDCENLDEKEVVAKRPKGLASISAEAAVGKERLGEESLTT